MAERELRRRRNRDPERNLPISLIGGTLAVVAIYVLVNVVYLRALGLEGLAGTTHARRGRRPAHVWFHSATAS